MRYDKVVFLSGAVTGEGYQEIENGAMVRLTDLDGNTVDSNQVMSYTATEADVATPTWGTAP